MVIARRLTPAFGALALLLAHAASALASGPSATEPWYLDQYGGDLKDLEAHYEGRLGVVMPTAPRPMGFIDWRLLHRLKVGAATGDTLASPCCGAPWWRIDWSAGATGWAKARKDVTGKDDQGYIATERRGADQTSTPNCFDSAFDTAAATLRDRAARYGAASPAVRAWLQTQDAVFKACSEPDAALPPPLPNAPGWLARDRAYQEAAFALYQGRNDEAARRFESIGQDPSSPWRASGPYLAARALIRQALADNTPAAYARAHAAVKALASAPPDALGRADVAALQNVLAYHEDPRAFLALLVRRLDDPTPSPSMAVDFRDYTDLGEAADPKPDALDWIDTIHPRPAPAPVNDATGAPSAASAVARYETARTAALAHAGDRWRQSRDLAWLVAAISLADADDPTAPELIRAAEQAPPSEPAWLTLQHHILRLTLASAPAAESQRRLDAILARTDLSVGDRNIFAAQRAQVSHGLQDFARFALRRRLCIGADREAWAWTPVNKAPPACVRQRWDDEIQRWGIYDRPGRKGTTGLGEDARAIIDRAPLADRIALSHAPDLPALIRLDIALTSYARAVQLQDDASIDVLARELETLLPLMAGDFRAIPRARPGPGKRFAEFLVLAKIPGVRVDLADYVRPEGRRVADFQDHWTDWVVLRRPAASAAAPPLVDYQGDGTGFERYVRGAWPDAKSDLTCLGECGAGSAPLRLPDFIAAHSARASAERAFFFKTDHPYDKPAPAMPPGAVDVWEEMLAYAKAHRADPRIPEALHWLVHVGHFGGSHNHSGHRAFQLLHSRYPGSVWAKRTPYYND